MTLVDDLQVIRARANLIESRLSALRPDEGDARAFDLWSEGMALAGEQFHGIMLSLRTAVELELGCGPTPDELASLAELEPAMSDETPPPTLERDGYAIGPVLEGGRTRAHAGPWIAAAAVLAVAVVSLVVALVLVTT